MNFVKLLKPYKVDETNLVYQKTEVLLLLNKKCRQLKRFYVYCTLHLIFWNLDWRIKLWSLGVTKLNILTNLKMQDLI